MMLVIHLLSDCGTVLTFLSGLSRVSWIRLSYKILGHLKILPWKSGDGSRISRNGVLPKMEGSVFETKGLNPSSNYDHWTKWTERVCPNSDLDTALTCFWSVLLCRNWLVEFSDQELVYRLETSPNYLFPRKIFFHITVNHFFNVIGNWTTLDK